MRVQGKAFDGKQIVQKVDHFLALGDMSKLGLFLNEVGFDFVFSEATLADARAMRRTASIVFLASFAAENGLNQERAAFWRDIYLGFSNKNPDQGCLTETANASFSALVRVLIDRSEIVWSNLSVKSDRVVDAFEILFDLGGLESALSFFQELPSSHLSASIFSKLINTSINRQKFLSTDIDRERLAKLYEKFCVRVKQGKHENLFNIVHLMLGDAYTKIKADGLALQAFGEAYRYRPELRTLAVMAQAASRIGDHDCSIQTMDRLISGLLEVGVKGQAASPAADILFPIPGEGTYTAESAQIALSALLTSANECGVSLFLVSGTLLGFARLGGVLAHDKDIDLGIVGVDQLGKLLQQLLHRREFQILPNYMKGEDTIHQPVIHGPTGVWIDIFVYYPKDDKWVTGVDIQFGYRQTFAFTPFDLVEADFMDTRVFVPRDFELNLRENFGDWKTPDKNYLSHIESPSLVEKGTLVHQLAMRLWVVRSLQYGFTGKLPKLIAKLEETQAGEGAMSIVLLDRLRACVPLTQ